MRGCYYIKIQTLTENIYQGSQHNTRHCLYTAVISKTQVQFN